MTSNKSRIVVAVVVGILLIGLLIANLPTSNEDVGSTTTTTSLAGNEPLAPQVEEDDDYQPPDVGDIEESAAAETARRFISAWARPDIPFQTWFDGVRPYLSSAAIASYQFVDPGEVPSRIVSGSPDVQGATPTQYIVLVPTDSATIRVVLNGQFKVTYIEPERSGPATAQGN